MILVLIRILTPDLSLSLDLTHAIPLLILFLVQGSLQIGKICKRQY